MVGILALAGLLEAWFLCTVQVTISQNDETVPMVRALGISEQSS